MEDISWQQVQQQAARIAETWRPQSIASVYGVPRGGVVPAAMVATKLGVPVVDRIFPGTLVVDDLIDSGRTLDKLPGRTADTPCDVLFRKPHSPARVALGPALPEGIPTLDGWLVFPWERAEEATGPADAVVRLLEAMGENPTREGLVDTPRRVLASFAELTSGYQLDPADVLGRTFPHDGYGGMVVVRDVDFTSVCEHHLLIFTGTAAVGYVPGDDNRIVGLSKLARVVDVYARRLQVQERMTEQIADAVEKHLAPKGVAVVVRAHHSCMSCRGVRKAHADMITSSMRGVMLDKAEARAEFMTLALA